MMSRQLKHHLRQVFWEGKKNGLRPTEIQCCVDSVIQHKPTKLIKPCKGFLRKRNFLLLVICLLVVATFCLYYGPVKMFFKRHMQYVMYLINRRIRLLFLPLIKYRISSDPHKSDCLVQNPWFENIDLDCQACSSVSVIKSYRNIQNPFPEFNTGIVMKISDCDVANVTFDNIKTRFQNYFEMERQLGEVTSSNEEWNSIDDVFGYDITSSEFHVTGSYVHWHVNDLRSHNFIRNITPQPYPFPSDAHSSIERYMFIDPSSSDHQSYKLPNLQFDNIWLSQIQGVRRVVLHPVSSCENYCIKVETEIIRGETLYFNSIYWEASSYKSNGDEISIGIAGSVL